MWNRGSVTVRAAVEYPVSSLPIYDTLNDARKFHRGGLGAVALSHLRPESLVSPAINPDEIIIRASPSVNAVDKSLGVKAAISQNRLLIRYARESGFFEEGETHKSFRRDNVRGLRLNLTRVPKRCEVSGLVYLNEWLRGVRNDTGYAKAA